MNADLLRKYARFLIRDCLKLEKGQPLLVVGYVEIQDFIELVKEEAKQLGSGEILTICMDRLKLRELYLHHTLEECLESPLLDRQYYNLIAEKNGALLSLNSPYPHINDGVDSQLLGDISRSLEKRIAYFRQKQEQETLAWCIAAVANPIWAQEILPNDEQALQTLWNYILDICHIDEEQPEVVWERHFSDLDRICQILNTSQIKTLHYRSTNGTDFSIDLPDDYRFTSAKESKYIVNMPSLEVFTTPVRNSMNGIVYSTKPLYYNGVEITDFWISFSNGRAVLWDAKTNKDMLTQIIETDEGSHYLGEVALISYDSKINQSGIVFQTTLYDENASCHLALGRGFKECFRSGDIKTMKELESLGLNLSSTHVDFMIGSRDLSVVAQLRDGTEMILMKDGNLVI